MCCVKWALEVKATKIVSQNAPTSRCMAKQVPHSEDKASKQLSPLHFKSFFINQMRNFNANMRHEIKRKLEKSSEMLFMIFTLDGKIYRDMLHATRARHAATSWMQQSIFHIFADSAFRLFAHARLAACTHVKLATRTSCRAAFALNH